MSGAAIQIYLETIAKGDGAQKTASDLAAVSSAAKKANADMAASAKQAATAVAEANSSAAEKAKNPWVTTGRTLEGLERQYKAVVDQFKRTAEGTDEFKRLGAEVARTKKEIEDFTARMRAAATTTNETAKAVAATEQAVTKAVNPWVTTGNTLEGLQRRHKAAMDQLARTPEGTAEFERLRQSVSYTGKELEAFEGRMRRVPPAQQAVTRGGADMGMAMLQGGRAIQDLQYGIGGVLNNLEGLAAAMGLGAGVAGAATVLGVALYILGPKIAEVTGLNELLADASGETKKKLEEQANAAGAELAAALDLAGKMARQFIEEQRAQEEAIQLANEKIEHQIALLKMRDQLLKSKEQVRLEGEVEDIKSRKLSPEDEAKALKEAYARSAQANADQSEATRRAEADIKSGATDTAKQELKKTEDDRDALRNRRNDAAAYNDALHDAALQREKVKEAEAAAAYYSTEAGTPDSLKKAVEDARAKVEELEAKAQALIDKYGQVPGFDDSDAEKLKHHTAEADTKREAVDKARADERALANQQEIERKQEAGTREIEATRRNREIDRDMVKRQAEERDKAAKEAALAKENQAKEAEMAGRDEEAARKRRQAKEITLGPEATEQQKKQLELEERESLQDAKKKRDAEAKKGHGGGSHGGGGGDDDNDSAKGFTVPDLGPHRPFHGFSGDQGGDADGGSGQGFGRGNGGGDGNFNDAFRELMRRNFGGGQKGGQTKRLGAFNSGGNGEGAGGLDGLLNGLQDFVASNQDGSAEILAALQAIGSALGQAQADNRETAAQAKQLANQFRNSRPIT